MREIPKYSISNKKSNFMSSRLDEMSSGLYETGGVGRQHSKDRHSKHRHWTTLKIDVQCRCFQCRFFECRCFECCRQTPPPFHIAQNLHRAWNYENSFFSLMMEYLDFTVSQRRLDLNEKTHTHTHIYTHTHTQGPNAPQAIHSVVGSGRVVP